MHLENLNLVHFKNYENLKVDFSQDINCLVGENGSGKTNLLDAIYYLSFTKSAFNPVDIQIIQHESDYFSVIGTFSKNSKAEKIRCSLMRGDKKKVFQGKKQLDRASDHIGNFPVVLVAPNDTDLILEGSETRRKYFDSLISQFDREYLENLIFYNHALKQRNELIKQFYEKNKVEYDLLEPYDHLLLKHGASINEKRSTFCSDFVPILNDHYQKISDGKEEIKLRYQSAVSDEDFLLQYKNALKKDLVLQRTTLGVHRDDFVFEIDGYPLKKFGSQGQQKSFVIAVKLAHFDILKAKKGFKPILLLDDIFDKLDDRRIEKLLTMINTQSFGQVFMTDARPERTKHFVSNLEAEVRVFKVEKGEIIETDL